MVRADHFETDVWFYNLAWTLVLEATQECECYDNRHFNTWFCKPVCSLPSFFYKPKAAGTKGAHSLIMLCTWEWDLQKPTNPNIQSIVHELPKWAREKSAGEKGVLHPPAQGLGALFRFSGTCFFPLWIHSPENLIIAFHLALINMRNEEPSLPSAFSPPTHYPWITHPLWILTLHRCRVAFLLGRRDP